MIMIWKHLQKITRTIKQELVRRKNKTKEISKKMAVIHLERKYTKKEAFSFLFLNHFTPNKPIKPFHKDPREC